MSSVPYVEKGGGVGLDTDGPSANFLASCWKFSIGRIVMTKHTVLSRRERQIMDIIYQRRKATAAEVMEHLPDPPSYSAVRALLRVLEEKGHVRHKHDGPRYVFFPHASGPLPRWAPPPPGRGCFACSGHPRRGTWGRGPGISTRSPTHGPPG